MTKLTLNNQLDHTVMVIHLFKAPWVCKMDGFKQIRRKSLIKYPLMPTDLSVLSHWDDANAVCRENAHTASPDRPHFSPTQQKQQRGQWWNINFGIIEDARYILGAHAHIGLTSYLNLVINFGPCLPLLELADEGSARFLMNLITCGTERAAPSAMPSRRQICSANPAAYEKIWPHKKLILIRN